MAASMDSRLFTGAFSEKGSPSCVHVGVCGDVCIEWLNFDCSIVHNYHGQALASSDLTTIDRACRS